MKWFKLFQLAKRCCFFTHFSAFFSSVIWLLGRLAGGCNLTKASRKQKSIHFRLNPKGLNHFYMWNQNVFIFLICTLSFGSLQGQDSINVSADVDSKYLEDQFYAGLTYNILLNRPANVIQRNLSYGLQLGFIKDIPINTKRNFGFGLGVGYGTNSYYSNIISENIESATNYRFQVEDDDLNRTKFETHAIEFPFEIRWRTSNATDYKFWRVYGGIKTVYLFSRKSKFIAENKENNFSFQNDDISQWQYGLTLNFGYNTWNVHLYYSLNPLLEDTAVLNGGAIDMRPLRLGVIFYIL